MTTRYGPGAPILDDGRFSGKYELFKTQVAPLNLPALAKAGMPEIEELQPGVIRATRRGPDWGQGSRSIPGTLPAVPSTTSRQSTP